MSAHTVHREVDVVAPPPCLDIFHFVYCADRLASRVLSAISARADEDCQREGGGAGPPHGCAKPPSSEPPQ